MDVKTIIDRLRRHNRWRLGEGHSQPVNARTLTETIDAAGAELERFQWRDISTAPALPEKFNAWVVTKCGTAWFEKECYIDARGDIRDFYSNLVNEFGRRATHWIPVIPGPDGGDE